MFESAELGNRISKDTYIRALPKLRESLLDSQYEIYRKKPFPVIIIVSGFDCSGRGETVNTLMEWIDPRYVEIHSFRSPSSEEESRPPMWRFWRTLPANGRIAVYFAGWYGNPIQDYVDGSLSRKEFEHTLEEIRQFELMLVNEGVLVLKFWFHLSKKGQRQRLEKLSGDKNTRWRVQEADWKQNKNYDNWRSAADAALRGTSTTQAPWFVVDAGDVRFRHLTLGRLLRDAMRRRMRRKPAPKIITPSVDLPPRLGKSVLSELDLDLKLDHAEYDKKLAHFQAQLNLLVRRKRFKEHGLIGVFEGPDASGKGGAIRRIVQALDARQLRVVPISAPTDEELAHPYLWRFWRRFPAKDEIVLFDRSWYGRVLVERVEKLCAEPDWRRAYAEICEFEEELARHGMLLMKFYLQVSPREQKRRLRERERTAYKRYKISRNDWRNLKLRKEYDQAACDMVERTSTEISPWTLVEADDKHYARIKVMRSLCERIEEMT